MISNFRNISFKSPRNNSVKIFQLYLLVLSLHLAFLLAWYNNNNDNSNKKRYNSYLEAAGV